MDHSIIIIVKEYSNLPLFDLVKTKHNLKSIGITFGQINVDVSLSKEGFPHFDIILMDQQCLDNDFEAHIFDQTLLKDNLLLIIDQEIPLTSNVDEKVFGIFKDRILPPILVEPIDKGSNLNIVLSKVRKSIRNEKAYNRILLKLIKKFKFNIKLECKLNAIEFFIENTLFDERFVRNEELYFHQIELFNKLKNNVKIKNKGKKKQLLDFHSLLFSE